MGVYASAKPASPANDMGRHAVPKADVAITSAIIFTSSVLSGAIRSAIFQEREHAGTGWHDTTVDHLGVNYDKHWQNYLDRLEAAGHTRKVD